MVITRGQKRARCDGLVAEASELLLQDGLSPRSRKDAKILHTNLARTAYDDAKELENCREKFDLLKRSVEKSKQINELKTSLKKAQRETSVEACTREVTNHEKWCFLIGDWCGDIMTIVKSAEVQAKSDEQRAFKAELQARGPRDQRYYTISEVESPNYFDTNVQGCVPSSSGERLGKIPRQLPLPHY